MICYWGYMTMIWIYTERLGLELINELLTWSYKTHTGFFFGIIIIIHHHHSAVHITIMYRMHVYGMSKVIGRWIYQFYSDIIPFCHSQSGSRDSPIICPTIKLLSFIGYIEDSMFLEY